MQFLGIAEPAALGLLLTTLSHILEKPVWKMDGRCGKKIST